MKLIKVGAAVLNLTHLDWVGDGQPDSHRHRTGTPEIGDLLPFPTMPDRLRMRRRLRLRRHHRGWPRNACGNVPATRGMVVSFGVPILYQNGLFNCACLVADGVIAGFVAKRFLAGDGIHYEPRWFKPWPAGVRSQARSTGAITLSATFLSLAAMCESALRFAKMPGWPIGRERRWPSRAWTLSSTRARVILHSANWKREAVRLGRFARTFGASYIYANLFGNEAGRAIYDGGALIAVARRLAAAGPRFSFQEMHVTSAVVDVEAIRMGQARSASFQPQITGSMRPGFMCPLLFLKPIWKRRGLKCPPGKMDRIVKEEEFARAEAWRCSIICANPFHRICRLPQRRRRFRLVRLFDSFDRRLRGQGIGGGKILERFPYGPAPGREHDVKALTGDY